MIQHARMPAPIPGPGPYAIVPAGRPDPKERPQPTTHPEARGTLSRAGLGDSEDPVNLMARLREGDERALRCLVATFWDQVVSQAFRVVECPDAAEDVAQEVFVRLWRERESWRRPGSVPGYLATITRNEALNQKRSNERRNRREHSFELEMDRSPDTPEDVLQKRELRRQIAVAIRGLPPRRREVFVRAYLWQCSYREIAQAMGISLQTVANQLSRAMAQLRQNSRTASEATS